MYFVEDSFELIEGTLSFCPTAYIDHHWSYLAEMCMNVLRFHVGLRTLPEKTCCHASVENKDCVDVKIELWFSLKMFMLL